MHAVPFGKQPQRRAQDRIRGNAARHDKGFHTALAYFRTQKRGLSSVNQRLDSGPLKAGSQVGDRLIRQLRDFHVAANR